MNSATALLVFSRSSSAEAERKKLLFGKKQNQKAVSAFISHAVNLAHSSNIPWYLSDEKSQRGNSFGEKLSNAILDTISKGYKKVIIIGNDCPQLTKQHIQTAIDCIDSKDWVLGPDGNGGAYLIGLNVRTFDKEIFEKINWQTKSVFSDLIQMTGVTSQICYILDTLTDINSYRDLATILKGRNSRNLLLRLLKNLFTVGLAQFSTQACKTVNGFELFSNNRRGPPVALLLSLYR